MVGLVASGLTAFPLAPEAQLLNHALGPVRDQAPALTHWIELVSLGLSETGTRYPFLAYGTDWLAFAHLMIAVAFWGPLKDPVRNIWVVQFGLIACAGIIPLALICGPIRGIPFIWTCIDMSFGVVGAIPLLLAYRHIRRLDQPSPVPAAPTALVPPEL